MNCYGKVLMSVKPKSQAADIGSDVVFKCEGDFCDMAITFYPYYSVSWYRNSEKIRRNNIIRHNTSLTFRYMQSKFKNN